MVLQEYDDTPLHDAVREGQAKTVDILIQAGANINAQNKEGKAAVDLANKDIRQVIQDSANIFERSKKKVPREIQVLGERATLRYLAALKEKATVSNVIRVMLVGHFGVGKTTIAKHLLDKKVRNIKSTDGIDVYINQCLYSKETSTWHTKGKNNEAFFGTDAFIRVDLVDFAGQLIFYTTHLTYLTSRGLYLLVFDLTKGLHGEVDDEDLHPSKRHRRHVIDFLDYWITTIITYARNERDNFPKIILIGTHKDEVKDSQVIEGIKSGIEEAFKDMLTTSQLVLRDDLFIDAFNMSDEIRDRIRKVILDEGMSYPEFNERVPLSWIHLQRKLMQMKENGHRIISIDSLRDLNTQLENPLTEEDLGIFLLYLHNLGLILYFNSPLLRDKIVLDPKFVIDAMKCFITSKRFILGFWKEETWDEMRRSGKIETSFIKNVWKKNLKTLNPELSDHMLAVMEKLDLICKPMIYDKGEKIPSKHHLVPCMVDRDVPENFKLEPYQPIPKDAQHTFAFSSSSVLPSAIFNRLICSALALWEVYQDHLYNGLVVLKCGMYHLIKIKRDIREIKVTVLDNKQNDLQLCLAVKRFLVETLHRIVAVYTTLEKVGITCDSSVLDDALHSVTHGALLPSSPEYSVCRCEGFADKCLDDIILMRIAKELQAKSTTALCAVLLNDAVYSELVEKKYDRTQCDLQVFCILQEWKRRTEDFSVTQLWELLEQDFDKHIVCRAFREKVMDPEALSGTLQTCMVYTKFLDDAANHISYEYMHLGLELGLTFKEIERARMEKSILEVTRFILNEWYHRKKEEAIVLRLTKAFLQCSINYRDILQEFDLQRYISREGEEQQKVQPTSRKCILL